MSVAEAAEPDAHLSLIRALYDNELCVDVDTDGNDPAHRVALQLLAQEFPGLYWEYSPRGGAHGHCFINDPVTLPGKIEVRVKNSDTPINIDLKRGDSIGADGEPCGGGYITIGGNPIGSKRDITPINAAELERLIDFIEANGGNVYRLTSPRGLPDVSGVELQEVPAMGATFYREAMTNDPQHKRLCAALAVPLTEPCDIAGYGDTERSERRWQFLKDLFSITRNVAAAVDLFQTFPAGAFRNRTKQDDFIGKPELYTKALIKEATKAAKAVTKQEQEAASVTINLTPESTAANPVKRRLSYSSFTTSEAPKRAPVIIEGLLTAGVCYLYGASKSYKSFLALAMCGAIAKRTGYFNGRKIAGGHALYIAAEAPMTIPERRYAWAKVHNNGQPLPQWHTIEGAVNFTDPDTFAELVELCDEIAASNGEPLRLIVVDTFSRTFTGNENSTEDTMKFHNAVDALAQRYACAVIVVHHSGKDESRGMRGSSAMYAAADTVISCKRGDALSITIELDKSKVGADGEIVTLPLRVVELPPEFAKAAEQSDFTTIPDPHREALRRKNDFTSLVVIDDPLTHGEMIVDQITQGGEPVKQFKSFNDALWQYMRDEFTKPAAQATIRNGLPLWAKKKNYEHSSLDKRNKINDALNALIAQGKVKKTTKENVNLYKAVSYGN
ncbi:TPA: AAA family ATPase [Enterobacter hormaechei subsp. xiangfangensis]|nr:AAA family ATPase [Enterobacter hormaechei subsp. xiangfangensis]